MASIIKYVAGFPKDIAPDSERFEDARKFYELGPENVDVWEYTGSLTSVDFRALQEVLTSRQYFELENSRTPGDKKRFLSLVRRCVSGDAKLRNPYHSAQLQSLPETSENFLPILEELLEQEGVPLSQTAAENYLFGQAERSGLYVPISFSYPYQDIEDLDYDRRVLIYIDGNLKGEVTLRKTKEYFDWGAGQTEEGVATIKIGKTKRNVDWNWWQSNAIRHIIDPKIRKDILKEKEKGIRFTRL